MPHLERVEGGRERRCWVRAAVGLAALGTALTLGCASPPDQDADGVRDEIDNCVEVFNPTQYDRDGDGKGWACDFNAYLRAATFDPLSEEERYAPDLTTDQETGYYYLQGHRGDDPTLDERLAELGIEVLDWFDGEVYVVRTTRSLAELRSEPGVRAAGIYQPANRVEPELVLGRYLAADGTPMPGLGKVELEVWVYRDLVGVAKQIRGLGGTAQPATDAMLIVQLPGERLPELLRLPDVNLVMPRAVVRAESDYVAAVTHVAELAELRGLTGAGELITIADSGLDSGNAATLHPDLAGRVVGIEEWGTGTAVDLTGHGTHVAGIAVGSGAVSGGRLRGAAPAAELRFQAVGRPVPAAGTPASEPTICFGRPKLNLRERKAERPARKPMELAGLPEDYTRLFAGASIHSNSWGSCQSEYTPRVGRIDQFLIDNPGVTVLFAAGNDADHPFLGDDGTVLRRGGDSLTNTARAKNVITVGASGTGRPQAPSGGPEQVMPFSSKGELASGRVKPDLVAPGQFVLAPRSRVCLDGEATATVLGDEVIKEKQELSHERCIGQGLPERVGAPELGDEYMLKSGTSMATPHVAGLVALVREWLRRHHGYRQPSAALIRAVLINGAVDLPDQDAGLRQPLHRPTDCTGYPNPCEGWGRVDAEASLYPGGEADLVQWLDRVSLGRSGERREFTARFAPGAPAAITLVWADPPPETLQNDLDLIVEAPDGTRFLGNTFEAGSGASWPDPPVRDPRLNNNVVERVVIPEPRSGSYRIEVAAARLRRRPQTFALVASAARVLE